MGAWGPGCIVPFFLLFFLCAALVDDSVVGFTTPCSNGQVLTSDGITGQKTTSSCSQVAFGSGTSNGVNGHGEVRWKPMLWAGPPIIAPQSCTKNIPQPGYCLVGGGLVWASARSQPSTHPPTPPPPTEGGLCPPPTQFSAHSGKQAWNIFKRKENPSRCRIAQPTQQISIHMQDMAH